MQGLNIAAQKEMASQEDAGTEVHILGLDDMPLFYEGPEGKDMPVTITVVGTNAAKFREIEDRQRKRRIKPKDLTGMRLHRDAIEKVSFCTLTWVGVFEDDGVTPVNCDFDHCRVLYQEVPHVYQQIVEAMGDAENFFGSGSTK